MAWAWLNGLGIRDWAERRRVFKELKDLERESSYSALDDTNPLNLAKVSVRVGDLAEAARRWEEAVVRLPALVRTSRDSIAILLALGRFEEAEILMTRCQKEFPGDPHYAEGYAKVAQHRGDTAEAIARWQKARKRFPGSFTSYVEETGCLVSLGKIDEAANLITQATRKFPEELLVWIQWARLADTSQDWNLSAERWQDVSTKFGWVGATIGLSRALDRLGRPDEALRVLTAEAHRFPTDADFRKALQHARRQNESAS